MKFCFGDIVVVENNLIGVICKSWIRNNEEIVYEVYVRSYNEIKEYKEEDIQRYMVRHKELSGEELEYQEEAYHPFITENDIKEFFGNLNLKGGE
ncbi:hypothetical protein [uncultured Clostridium sp.]|uniref:hypothetical protein n=1 Tax=uncultured Clostridium sp. TaxID=59620 RepID=UPI0026EB63B5|nr:hypothetical protein [uncultured Clostridium sp.]